MVRHHLSIAALASLFALQAVPPALAQQPPAAAPVATSRCGGLFCDMYYSGKPLPAPGQPDVPSPTSLPCRDFICAAFGGRTAEAAPPAAQPAPEPAAEPVKRKRKAHKTIASVGAAAEAAK